MLGGGGRARRRRRCGARGGGRHRRVGRAGLRQARAERRQEHDEQSESRFIHDVSSPANSDRDTAFGRRLSPSRTVPRTVRGSPPVPRRPSRAARCAPARRAARDARERDQVPRPGHRERAKRRRAEILHGPDPTQKCESDQYDAHQYEPDARKSRPAGKAAPPPRQRGTARKLLEHVRSRLGGAGRSGSSHRAAPIAASNRRSASVRSLFMCRRVPFV